MGYSQAALQRLSAGDPQIMCPKKHMVTACHTDHRRREGLITWTDLKLPGDGKESISESSEQIEILTKELINMRKILSAIVCIALLSGCVTPISYGDASGFMGMGFLAKKTVILGYDGAAKPFEEVGVLALDARLRIHAIRKSDGEVVRTQSRTIGGLGIINTPEDVQIHLLPGDYIVTACFFIDMGNQGSMYCRSPLTFPVSLEASQLLQLSWSSAEKKGWTVLQEPAGENTRNRIVQDFLKVMTTEKTSS